MTKPILIVGGGPAGLAAAHALTQVGTSAVLVEKTDRLGGAPIHSGIFTDDPFYTAAVLIIPGTALTPLLAASGVEPAAGILAAALLLVAGLVLVRRRGLETRAPQL